MNLVDPHNGRMVGAKGGSELMYDTLLAKLPRELSDPFQFIVSRVRELKPDKLKILWCQDPWNDREAEHLTDPELRKRFRKLVFVSHHQFTTFHHRLGVPFSETAVIGNAIEPIADRVPDKPRDRIRVIYHTMPDRGLRVLLPAFTALAERYPRLHLDVYSSFRLYGLERRDRHYQHLFDVCRSHPQITYHGTVPNDEIREALMRSHIFAYPCIAGETFCIAAVEAMSAGCLVVCSDSGALAETVGHHGLVYRFTEDEEAHKARFSAAMRSAIDLIDTDGADDLLARAQQRVNAHYTWDTRIVEWMRLLEGILEEDRTRSFR